MPNDLRTQNAPTLQYKNLERGAVFRFLRQEDLHEVWLKIEPLYANSVLGSAISLMTGERTNANPDSEVYRIRKVTIISPGEDRNGKAKHGKGVIAEQAPADF